jgi:hypothetical protein
MARPIYTPPEKIKTSLYTSGKEWMVTDTNKEYIGLYHQYPNNSTYTEAQFNEQSLELVAYVPAMETEFGGVYYKLTKKRFNNYITPEYYYPTPSVQDYERANMIRYFVRQRNNISHIMEIDEESYNNINRKNKPGIDAGRYRKTSIQWSITGPIDSVQSANERVMRNSDFDNITEYLTNPLEFYK